MVFQTPPVAEQFRRRCHHGIGGSSSVFGLLFTGFETFVIDVLGRPPRAGADVSQAVGVPLPSSDG